MCMRPPPRDQPFHPIRRSMRITVEVRDRTQVYVHDIKPVIAQLSAVTPENPALYVLRDSNYLESNALLAVFMERPQLEALYSQLRDLLEPVIL